MANRKYAVGIWDSEKSRYEIHDRTDILQYAQAKRDEYIKAGLKAICMELSYNV